MLQLGQRGADGQFLGADALTLAAARAVAGFFGVREVGRPLFLMASFWPNMESLFQMLKLSGMSTPMGQGIQ